MKSRRSFALSVAAGFAAIVLSLPGCGVLTGPTPAYSAMVRASDQFVDSVGPEYLALVNASPAYSAEERAARAVQVDRFRRAVDAAVAELGEPASGPAPAEAAATPVGPPPGSAGGAP